MAITTINQYDLFHQWRTKTNSISSNVGDLENLTTIDKSSSVSAINELNTMTDNILISDVSFTIGAETSDTIIISLQLKDAKGNDCNQPLVLDCYLASNSEGTSIISTVYSGGWNITSGTVLDEINTNKYRKIISNSSGQIVSNLINTGAKSSYWVVILPNGKLVISPTIIHV